VVGGQPQSLVIGFTSWVGLGACVKGCQQPQSLVMGSPPGTLQRIAAPPPRSAARVGLACLVHRFARVRT
jgi:hypothetical protein